jgi:hypothetical protein
MAEQQVKFCFTDTEITIPVKLTTLMITINDMLADTDGQELAIPMENQNSHFFRYIVEYCIQMVDDKDEKRFYIDFDPSVKYISKLTEWENNFLVKIDNDKIDKKSLIAVMNLSSFLNVPSLIEKISYFLANKTKDYSVEQFCEYFGIDPMETTKNNGENVAKQNAYLDTNE